MDGKTDLVILALIQSEAPLSVAEAALASGLRRDVAGRRLAWLERGGRADRISEPGEPPRWRLRQPAVLAVGKFGAGRA